VRYSYDKSTQVVTLHWSNPDASHPGGTSLKYSLTDGTLDNLDSGKAAYWMPIAIPKAGTTIIASIHRVHENFHYDIILGEDGRYDMKDVFYYAPVIGAYRDFHQTGRYTISGDGVITFVHDDGGQWITTIGVPIDASGQANPNERLLIANNYYVQQH
jgi:hypothetical protein